MAETVFTTKLMDEQMKEVFDWSNDSTPVRDAIWDYYMENNGKDTVATVKEMKKFDNMGDTEIKSFVEEKIRK